MAANDLKLLVVDDHALTREGMRLSLLKLQDSVCVLEAGTADEALAVVRGHANLDLVLLDLELPGASGMSLLQKLRRDLNGVPVVVISGSDRPAVIKQALDLGATGYIPKTVTLDVLLQAVRLVLAGGSYIPKEVLPASRDVALRPASSTADRVQELTDRQRQILSLMAQGKPNKVIASELEIAEATVKSHVTEILRVLRVSNRTQAVIAAGKLGIA